MCTYITHVYVMYNIRTSSAVEEEVCMAVISSFFALRCVCMMCDIHDASHVCSSCIIYMTSTVEEEVRVAVFS